MRFEADEYYAIANADCISVAAALGMEIDDSKRSTSKAIHIKHSGGLFIFPDSNNWYRHSDGHGGFPVDLVMDELGCSREDALLFIRQNVNAGYVPSAAISAKPAFRLPPQTEPFRVRAYLTKTRGIDKTIIDSLIKTGAISEDAEHHNCMFIGKDKNGAARSCALRGTGKVQFRGEVSGGDKSHSFAIEGRSDKLRVFESPIDAMSHATFSYLLGLDWQYDHRLSANGCGHTAVIRYIKEHSEIKSVVLSLDNDEAGKTGAAAISQKIKEEFTEREIKVSVLLPIRKDWNEDLTAFRIEEKKGWSAFNFLSLDFPQMMYSH